MECTLSAKRMYYSHMSSGSTDYTTNAWLLLRVQRVIKFALLEPERLKTVRERQEFDLK